MAKKRTINDASITVDFYNGLELPYDDESFTTIYSGHIIEHTPNPYNYFKEHMRVLVRGGYFLPRIP